MPVPDRSCQGSWQRKWNIGTLQTLILYKQGLLSFHDCLREDRNIKETRNGVTDTRKTHAGSPFPKSLEMFHMTFLLNSRQTRLMDMTIKNRTCFCCRPYLTPEIVGKEECHGVTEVGSVHGVSASNHSWMMAATTSPCTRLSPSRSVSSSCFPSDRTSCKKVAPKYSLASPGIQRVLISQKTQEIRRTWHLSQVPCQFLCYDES